MTNDEMAAAWDALASTAAGAMVNTGADNPENTIACIAAITPWIERVAAEHPSLLEIGCGIGRLTIPIALRFPRAGILAFDVSSRMLEFARMAGRLEHVGDRVAFCHVAGLEDVRAGSVDLAWSVTTFQHVDAEGVRRLIAAAARTLRAGGVFRFQFVEHAEPGPLAHPHTLGDVGAWLRAASLEPVALDRGDVHPAWTWITARRIG